MYGQRWVSTPACRASRAVSDPAIDPIHYVTCYLMAEPIAQTLDDFFELGAELHRLDRFHEHRRAHLTGPFGVDRDCGRAAVLVSAAAVPYRAHRGIYVVVEDDDGSRVRPAQTKHRCLTEPGVAGVWTFTTPVDLAPFAAMDRGHPPDNGVLARRRSARGRGALAPRSMRRAA